MNNVQNNIQNNVQNSIQSNGVQGDVELPLSEHLAELRKRVIRVVVVVALLTGITYFFSGRLITIIWQQVMPPDVLPTVYSPMELVMTRLTLSLVIALAAGIPILVYEAFMFTAKGLFPNEKLFFVKIVPPSIILFFIGAAVAFYIAVPLIFGFAIPFSEGMAYARPSLSDTFSTIFTLVTGFGLVFQFPLIILMAIKMGIVKREQLKKLRKYVYVASLLIGLSFILSSDLSGISELLIAVSLILLFEIGLLVARFY